MSTTLLDRARDEATARIAQLEAQVENVQAAMNRPEQIAVLQAGLERAEAALQLSRADYDRQRKLYAEGHVAKAALDRAEMARARDEASVKEARRQVEASRMASRSQEIEAAEANLKQARAQLDAMNIRIKRQSVVAPADGVVQDVFFRPGEIVNAGQPVVALLPPENRKVRFYRLRAGVAENFAWRADARHLRRLRRRSLWARQLYRQPSGIYAARHLQRQGARKTRLQGRSASGRRGARRCRSGCRSPWRRRRKSTESAQ